MGKKRLAAQSRNKTTGAVRWTLNLKGKFKVKKRSLPAWHQVQGINWIEGGTLNRIKLLKYDCVVARDKVPPVGTKVWALVKPVTARQRELGCDKCSGFHRKNNAACSATIFGTGFTPASKQGAMYDFATGEPLDTTWVAFSSSDVPRCRIVETIYQRVA